MSSPGTGLRGLFPLPRRWPQFDRARQTAIAGTLGVARHCNCVPGVNYFDLHASYEVPTGMLAGLRLDVGVENLTDGDAPILADPFNDANTDPSQYDVLGRRYYVSLNYSF